MVSLNQIKEVYPFLTYPDELGTVQVEVFATSTESHDILIILISTNQISNHGVSLLNRTNTRAKIYRVVRLCSSDVYAYPEYYYREMDSDRLIIHGKKIYINSPQQWITDLIKEMGRPFPSMVARILKDQHIWDEKYRYLIVFSQNYDNEDFTIYISLSNKILNTSNLMGSTSKSDIHLGIVLTDTLTDEENKHLEYMISIGDNMDRLNAYCRLTNQELVTRLKVETPSGSNDYTAYYY